MQTKFDFFHSYQRNHGFVLNKNKDVRKEFDRLALFMKWEGKAYSLKRKEFLLLRNNPTAKPKDKIKTNNKSNPDEYLIHHPTKKSQNHPEFPKKIKEYEYIIKKPECLPPKILLKTDEENALCNQNMQGIDDLSPIHPKQNYFEHHVHKRKEENQENFEQKIENEERKSNHEKKWLDDVRHSHEENYDEIIQEFSFTNLN